MKKIESLKNRIAKHEARYAAADAANDHDEAIRAAMYLYRMRKELARCAG